VAGVSGVKVFVARRRDDSTVRGLSQRDLILMPELCRLLGVGGVPPSSLYQTTSYSYAPW
jgi:hypothetical protein